MRWNWQRDDWPEFRWKERDLYPLESRFLHQSGVFIGITKHLGTEDERRLVVDLISDEALKTSEIEGVFLDRESVQSSVRRNFGLDTDRRRVGPAERGISDMLCDVYWNYDKLLTHEVLFNWHRMLVNGRYDLKDAGCYRTQDDPMQIVSGRLDKPQVHFEAPPSKAVEKEMDLFMSWWQNTLPSGKNPLPALTRSAISHLYFVSIHPFEDGNGRIARALSEKSLAEYSGRPALIALSLSIERNRKEYYQALERANKDNEITEWVIYFSRTILQAQELSHRMIDFLVEKTKLFDRLRGLINERQEKVLSRMFREGLDGFKGGLSAENYISISGTSRATATRDLQDLLKKGALKKTGALKSTRYYLNIAESEKQVALS
jgi:Fic family protein